MSFNRLMKYARGTVWWMSTAQNSMRSLGNSSVQAKQRPVVIVSNNQRGRSTVVEVCCITSQDKSKTCPDINIPYVNTDGHTNYVECNQHFTVGTEELSRFLGLLPQDVMDSVDKGLLISQGLGYLLDSQNIISHLKSQIARTQALLSNIESMEKLQTELNTTIESMNSVLSGGLERTQRMEANLRDNLETRAAKNTTTEGVTTLPSAKRPIKRHRSNQLSADEIRRFLSEYEACQSKKEFAESHGYTIKSIYPRVSYLRKKLAAMQTESVASSASDSDEDAG